MARDHTNLINSIIKTYGDYPRWKIWANSAGTAFRAHRKITYGRIGPADIIGFLDNGQFLNIVLRVGREKETVIQRDFAAKVHQFNAVYFVARSLGDVDDFITKYSEVV